MTVTGASGSFASRKFFHALRPAVLPRLFSKAWSASAERTSAPPPLPKMPPISDASAITSVGFHSVGTCFSAAYSAGSLFGSTSVSSMYALMPATNSLTSLTTFSPSAPYSVDALFSCDSRSASVYGAISHSARSIARLPSAPPMNDDSSARAVWRSTSIKNSLSAAAA